MQTFVEGLRSVCVSNIENAYAKYACYAIMGLVLKVTSLNMVKIYFVCMGNYYRSRLAEELALYYAVKYGLEISVDSGGLSDVAKSLNPGPIAKATLRFLEDRSIEPQRAQRFPKRIDLESVVRSDFVVLTDEDEQLNLFKQTLPTYTGKIVAWRARDNYDDPWLQTPNLIDKHVHQLIKELLNTKS